MLSTTRSPGRNRFAADLAAGAIALLLTLAFASTSSKGATLDPAFGRGGFSFVAEGVRKEPALGITNDESGRLIVTGQGGKTGNQFYVARITEDGSPDPLFGDNGYAVTDFLGASHAAGIAPLVQPTGKMVVAGTVGLSALARLNPDGSVDRVFSSHGESHGEYWRLDEYWDAGTAIAQGRGGKFLVAGYGKRKNGTHFAVVVRYSPEGVPDPTFHGDRRTHSALIGHIKIAAGRNHPIDIGEMILMGGGRILLGGTYEGRFTVTRLRRDGSYDQSFGHLGMASIDVDGDRRCQCALAQGMARTADGRILLAGYAVEPGGDNPRLVLLRLTANGHLDRGFGHRGISVLRVPEGIAGFKVAVQHDGRIVVVGESGFQLAVARFDPDGKLDPTFFENGVFKRFVLGGPTTANDVLIDREGRIVVAGGDPHAGVSFVMRILPDAQP